jgi:hypothetical protein
LLPSSTQVDHAVSSLSSRVSPRPLPQPSTIRMRRHRGPRPLPLPMAAGYRCWDALGHLQPSQGALTSAAGASGARMPLALDSGPVLSPLTLQTYVAKVSS